MSVISALSADCQNRKIWKLRICWSRSNRHLTQSGVGEARKAVGQMETTVNRMVW